MKKIENQKWQVAVIVEADGILKLGQLVQYCVYSEKNDMYLIRTHRADKEYKRLINGKKLNKIIHAVPNGTQVQVRGNKYIEFGCDGPMRLGKPTGLYHFTINSETSESDIEIDTSTGSYGFIHDYSILCNTEAVLERYFNGQSWIVHPCIKKSPSEVIAEKLKKNEVIHHDDVCKYNDTLKICLTCKYTPGENSICTVCKKFEHWSKNK